MAVSRYSTPAQASFMSTYSPIPFNELLQAGLSKQQQYNTGQDYLDSAEANAENIKYIPGSMDESYIKDNVLATIKETVDEHSSKDFSDPNVMRAITKKLKSIDSQRVNRVQQSAQAYDKAGEMRRKLKSEGAYQSYLDNPNITNFSSESGVYDQMPERALDRRKPAEAIFNNIPDRFLYEKDLGNGMRGIMQGVGDSELRDAAKNNASDYLSTPEGKQFSKYLASVGVPEEGHLAETEKYLYEVGLEKKGAKQTSVYKDPNYKVGPSNGNFSEYNSATFDLEAQPFPEEFNTFKKVKKNKEANDAAISKLDQEISLVKKNASPKTGIRVSQLEAQKESLKSQNYATDQYFDKFNKEYIELIGKTSNDIHKEIFTKLVDKNIDVSGKEDAILAAVALFNKENKITGLSFAGAYEKIVDPNNLEKGNALQNDFGYKNWPKIQHIAESIRTNVSDYEKNKLKYIEDQWAILDKGITKETSLLPNTNNTGDKIQVPGTTDWVYNPLQGLLNVYESNPESLDIKRVTGENLSDKEKVKDLELIKKTLEGDSKTGKRGKLEFQSAGTFDPKSPFLNAVLYDASGTRVDNFTINISNSTQQKKIAESYALIGDVKNALKFENPTYSQDIAKKFDKGIKPSSVDLSILGNDIQLVLSPDESFYQIYSEGNLIPNSGIRASGGDIESAIYDLYKDNIMKIRQTAIINEQ